MISGVESEAEADDIEVETEEAGSDDTTKSLTFGLDGTNRSRT